ncbi:hypothetical protein K0M31_014271 [Melipona bicolor]|uniref:Uncharacterized protein n=1 Tax=Melipona bicolor TaxID=60889 RepID=A0AA40G8B0_9HYME|nr:hypothetical protein K0M31_014271 [Melipona bicolor]
MHLNLISGARGVEGGSRGWPRGGLVTPFATATPTEQPASQPASQPALPLPLPLPPPPPPPPPRLHGRGCNYCNYPHTSYACITPNPVRRGCGHLAPLTNRLPPAHSPAPQPYGFHAGDIILNSQLSEDFGHVSDREIPPCGFA